MERALIDLTCWLTAPIASQKWYSPDLMTEKNAKPLASEITAIGQLADMLDEGLLLTNTDGVVLSANQVAAKLFESDIVSKSIFDVIGDKRFGRAFHKTALRRAVLEIPYRSNDGSIEREFKLRIKRLGDGPIALLFLDLTRQKNLETVRRDFVANVSHELRSPLTSLAGFVETMLSGEVSDPEMRTRFLKIMDEEAKRMSRLVDDLLSLSRVEVEEHIVPETALQIVELVQSVKRSLEGQADRKKMRIMLRQDECGVVLSSAIIAGNQDEITEVFVNLIENAIKYGFENSDIIVSIYNDGQGMVKIDVINEGEGVEEQHLTRLTERFYRVDKARSRQIGGTGLGLAIVKHIVNRHRGTLTIESKPNQTTKFSVNFPLLPSVRFS